MNTIFNKELFSERLTQLMKDNNDTTYTLADYLHLSTASISRYMNCEMSPKRTTIAIMAEKYRVNPAWLMGGEGAEKYLEEVRYTKIPVYSFYINENENEVEYFENVLENETVHFCIRVNNDNMLNSRIQKDDIAFIRKNSIFDNGDVMLIKIDGEPASIKRYYKYGATIVLRTDNEEKEYKSSDKKLIEVIGKVITCKINIK